MQHWQLCWPFMPSECKILHAPENRQPLCNTTLEKTDTFSSLWEELLRFPWLALRLSCSFLSMCSTIQLHMFNQPGRNSWKWQLHWSFQLPWWVLILIVSTRILYLGWPKYTFSLRVLWPCVQMRKGQCSLKCHQTYVNLM
jgi:hypothetical protein